MSWLLVDCWASRVKEGNCQGIFREFSVTIEEFVLGGAERLIVFENSCMMNWCTRDLKYSKKKQTSATSH